MESSKLSKSKINKSLENKFALQEVLPSFRYFNLELNGFVKICSTQLAIVLINKTTVKWEPLDKYGFFSGSPACAKCVSEI